MSKTITRKYIQRITKREGNTNIRQSSGGGGGGGGGASQYWVEENYISKLFFNQLFTVYDEDGNVVEPNDTESVIASIKSMFGFWTDAYLSALGNGEGGGAELTLASLADVDVHGVANGQALVYDAYTQKWVPGQAGLDPTSLWQELGSLGTEQISSTHLTTALSTYNPTNNFKTINGNSIIGTGDIVISGGGGGGITPWPDYYYFSNGSGGYVGAGLGSDNGQLMFVNYKNRPISFGTNRRYEDMTLSDGNLSIGGSIASSRRLTVHGITRLQNDDAPGYIKTLEVGAYSASPYGIVFRAYVTGTNTINVERFSNDGEIFNLALCDRGGYVGIGTFPSYKLDVAGDIHLTNSLRFRYGEYLDEYGNVHQSASNALWCVYSNSNRVNLIVVSGSGYVGVGTSSPSYALHVIGVAYASTGVYSAGYVTALSDIRHKDVKGNVNLTVSEVANAPSVKFLWKDRRQEGLQVGSIAQYWQKVMPEAIVENADGELTMSYGVIALLASIATARKVEDHERRIRELEEENKKLKKQLNAA